MKRSDKKKLARRIAKERIRILFSLAESYANKGDLELSSRYVELILKIARKYNIRLPREMKYRICKKCNCFIIPGKNATVRLKKGKVVIKCLECGRYKRYPYK